MKKIKIVAGSVEVEAQLNNTHTAGLIWKVLPVDVEGSTWGEEIYFNIPVRTGLEEPRETVEKGDLAYWPSGPAFCIFFGLTPMSGPGEIRPASAVTVVGKVIGDPSVLRNFENGEKVQLEKIPA